MSRNQVNRLVRIDALVPELKKQVDDKKLPFNTAVELSYLKPEEQGEVVDYMRKEEIVPSMAQATALKEVSKKAQEAEKKAAKSEPSKPTAATKTTANPPMVPNLPPSRQTGACGCKENRIPRQAQGRTGTEIHLHQQ